MPRKKEAGAERRDGFPGREVLPPLRRLGDERWGDTLHLSFTAGEKSAGPSGDHARIATGAKERGGLSIARAWCP